MAHVNERISRRRFLHRSGGLVATAGLCRVSTLWAQAPPASDPSPDGPAVRRSKKSVVVRTQSDFVANASEIRTKVMVEMFDSALMKLANTDTVAAAWGHYLRGDDVVDWKLLGEQRLMLDGRDRKFSLGAREAEAGSLASGDGEGCDAVVAQQAFADLSGVSRVGRYVLAARKSDDGGRCAVFGGNLDPRCVFFANDFAQQLPIDSFYVLQQLGLLRGCQRVPEAQQVDLVLREEDLSCFLEIHRARSSQVFGWEACLSESPPTLADTTIIGNPQCAVQGDCGGGQAWRM